MKQTLFSEQLQHTLSKKKYLSSKASQYSNLRSLAAVFCLFFLILSFAYRSPFYGCIAAGTALSFILAVRKHIIIEEKLQFLCSKESIINRYLARFTNEWHSFAETGEEYLKEDNYLAKDLDLLGKHSLYQYLCCSNTIYGRKDFADHLLTASQNRTEPIPNSLERQQAVRELGAQIDFSIEFQALCHQTRPRGKYASFDDIETFLETIESKDTLIHPFYQILSFVLPVITLATLLTPLLGITLPSYEFLSMLALLLPLAFVSFQQKNMNPVLRPLLSFCLKAHSYQQIFACMQNKTFVSPYLNQLKERLRVSSGAVTSLKNLRMLGEAAAFRYNLLGFLLGNCFLMLDCHCLTFLGRWKKQYGVSLREWLIVIGHMETLLSLAVLEQVKEQTCYPDLSPQKEPLFQTEFICHPLICEKNFVGNSFHTNAKTVIFTGSNMSGKTTFLRSIGINLVLAYAGAPVTASRFAASSLALATSIRVEDNLSSGISTFYAEILRIKHMAEISRTGQPMLALVDEIFTGTNSADRIIGASKAIEKLSNATTILLVTTHDFELCSLKQPDGSFVDNYHFEEFYKEGQIQFDYQLRPGRCHTTNARQLLQMAGLL